MQTPTAQDLGYGDSEALDYNTDENQDERSESNPRTRVRMTRRGSTGIVGRTYMNGCLEKTSLSTNSEEAVKTANDNDRRAEERTYRRKPRRMSGLAALSTDTIKGSMAGLPCLLQRDDSVRMIQRRIQQRRASTGMAA